MTEHKSTNADIMAKKFSKKKPAPIKGGPNMAKLLRVLPYLQNYAKSHRMAASPVGILYIALPQPLYNLYTPHPTQIEDRILDRYLSLHLLQTMQ